MTIQSIESMSLNGSTLTIEAVVSEAVCTFRGTYFDPPEYDYGLCSASFTVDEDTPTEIDIPYLESLDLSWEPISML
jgi:hypothetical protein